MDEVVSTYLAEEIMQNFLDRFNLKSCSQEECRLAKHCDHIAQEDL